ncbi:hypothetical protein AB0L64_01320 [Kribbella sp. NPDC051936]|uniref:hypothetical protein n=1 Tax=Kribbella sp. NPDC051936 TaxID=3154946 RepID=UPI00341B4251
MITSFAELMRLQADLTVAVMRAHHSAWNNRYRVLPRGDDQVSKVTWDGTILYHPQDVIEPLQDMFDRAYLQHDDETLDRYREALRTLFHENIHLLAGPGTSLAFPLDAYEGRAYKVFEEGVTERATQNELDNFIDELGLEQIAPGIRKGQSVQAYAAYTPAVDAFSTAVGADVGLEPAEVIHRIAVVNTAEKFKVAAELLYTKHLSQLVPETARADAISRIAEAMHGPFAAVYDYDKNDPSDLRMAGLAGRSAFRSATAEIQTIAEHWAGNQDLRRALDAGLGPTTTPHRTPDRTQQGSRASDGPHSGGQGSDGPEQGGQGSTQPPSWSSAPGGHRRSASGPARLSRD